MAGWRIPLSDLNYDDAELEALRKPLHDRWLSMGPEVLAFEQSFAALVGVEHAVAVSSGTAALHLAYLALGLGPGDEVVQPATNFVAAANMTVAVGARPVFADIVSVGDPTISPAEIDRLIGPRTRAVVVMHYGGAACHMDEILRSARSRGIPIVEDACHAVGATYGPPAGAKSHQVVGSLGDIACFSFFSNKNMATGEGGMFVTRDPTLAERARLLRSHGMTTLSWDRFRGHARRYDVVAQGFNYRIDDLRAALGRAQLAKLAAANERRGELAARYRSAIDDDSRSLSVILEDRAASSSHHLMVAVCADQERRDAAVDALHGAGIQTSLHYPCITDFAAFDGYSGSNVPVSREFAGRALTLPLYPTLEPSAVDEIASILNCTLAVGRN